MRWICGGLAGLLVSGSALAQTDPLREWTTPAGEKFPATVLSFDGANVTLRLRDGRRWTTPLSGLSEADQTYLAGWQKRQPIKVEMPETVEVNAADLVIEEQGGDAPGENFRYRTPHFEFEAQGKFTQRLLRDVARNFEATFELLKALPWAIDPKPEGDRFQAKLFRYRQDYDLQAPANSSGVYKRNEKVFLVPFESIGLKVVGKSFAQDSNYDTRTLVHELTHQMMHAWLDLLPQWVIEGTAEYTANLPLQNGRFRVSAAKTGLKDYLDQFKKRGQGIPRPIPLEELFFITNKRWNEILEQDPQNSRRLYFTSYLMVYYFMHLDGEGDGQLFVRYFRAVDEVRQEVTAYEKAMEEFLKRPEVEVKPDGSYRWPSSLDHPKIPAVLESKEALEDFHRRTLDILLNGRSAEELMKQIRSAYAKLGVRI